MSNNISSYYKLKIQSKLLIDSKQKFTLFSMMFEVTRHDIDMISQFIKVYLFVSNKILTFAS
jgi:hypothetical protein